MTVPLRDERAFDVPARVLFALWTDPAFQEARSAHLGTLSVRCERREAPLVLVLDEVRDTGWKQHLFESRTVTRWDEATRRARWTITQTGGPGDAGAEGTLEVREEGPSRCRLILDGTLSVRVPLFGPMIERIASRGFSAERLEEARFVEAELRRRASSEAGGA